MFEQEIENIRSSAGRLKAEIQSTNLPQEKKNAATAKVDEAVSQTEDALADRAASADREAKKGTPHLDGKSGLVGVEHEKSDADAGDHAVDKINKMADAVKAV
jgi:hypothetical protein